MKYVVNVIKIVTEPQGPGVEPLVTRQRFFSTSRGSIGDDKAKLAQVVEYVGQNAFVEFGEAEIEVYAIANGCATRCNLDGSIYGGEDA